MNLGYVDNDNKVIEWDYEMRGTNFDKKKYKIH